MGWLTTMHSDVVLVAPVRTAIGRYQGGFKATPAAMLGAAAIAATLERASIPVAEVDEVIMGCVGQVGDDAFNARLCALQAGLPVTSLAYNVNRLCGSGLQALNSAAMELLTGQARLVVAGGDENMTMQPYLLPKAGLGQRYGNATLIDGTQSLVTDPFGRYAMGCTAERVAERYGVSREEQDAFAAESQRRAAAALADRRFVDQIVPVAVPQAKGEVTIVQQDEHPRPEVTAERLARLRPAFREGGSVTAGNSSGINDAAAAMVLMRQAEAQARGCRPMGRLAGWAVAGVDPEVMGIAPVDAVRKLLDRTGMALDDIDLIELNEAFAAQSVAVIRALHADPEKVNVNGGAIALGHPVGATGAILATKLLYELQRRDKEWGIVTLCIGGGQGIASLFQRV
jgi:acetyl-CoA C-acetyltransferase